MITGLSQVPMHPEDWVIVADMDEYFTYGSSSTVQEAVQAMEEEGATFALGQDYLDSRLSRAAHHGFCDKPALASAALRTS